MFLNILVHTIYFILSCLIKQPRETTRSIPIVENTDKVCADGGRGIGSNEKWLEVIRKDTRAYGSRSRRNGDKKYSIPTR